MGRKEYMPPMPEIGHSEGHYARLARRAEAMGDVYAHSAYKVGQYITLARGGKLTWTEKLKYFYHALDRHCQTPHLAPEAVWVFYHNLANVVRCHAGQEAIRMAEAENSLFARRLEMGQSRETLAAEAGRFYGVLLGGGDKCPTHFNRDNYERLKELHRQWVAEEPA